jgi:hypothetical protein
LQTS